MFRLIDLCSSYQTELKEEAASRFESLEPLEYHLLRDADFIKFGTIVVTFHNPSVVESSQLAEPMTPSFATAKSKLFVPETQELDCSIGDPGMINEINIPETEALTQAFAASSKKKGSATTQVLTTVKEFEEHNYDDEAPQCFRIRKEPSHDSSDENDSFHSLDNTKAAPEGYASRDGSVTPDLSDRDGSVTPDNIILPETPAKPENGLKKEKVTPATLLQSMIETDDSGTDDEREEKAKYNQSIYDPTQPFYVPLRTRFQQKRQAELRPPVVSLTDFDFTQDLEYEPSQKKACYDLETEAIMPEIPEDAIVGAKVVNRILMSSDEDNSVEKTVVAEVHECEVNVEPSTPEERSDSPFGCDIGTPDFFPRLPSDSQIGAFLDIANASQTSIDNTGAVNEDVSPRNNKENIWHPPQQEAAVIQNPIKKRRPRIMKYDDDNDDEAGPSSRVKIKQRPKKSCAILISNGTQDLNNLAKNAIETLDGKIVDRVAEADVLLTQGRLKLTAKILASICRRIPIVGSDYLEASLLAGGWLDSKLFIICDAKLEERKKFSLKGSIQSTVPKIFETFSVFTTKHTNIPRELMAEIIENAGGEFLENFDQQPTRDKVAVIFSTRDVAECEAITEKYNGILKIADTSFVNNVLNQKL